MHGRRRRRLRQPDGEDVFDLYAEVAYDTTDRYRTTATRPMRNREGSSACPNKNRWLVRVRDDLFDYAVDWPTQSDHHHRSQSAACYSC